MEGVAKLVLFGVTQQISIGAPGIHQVVTHPVFLQMREYFPKRLLANTANAPGR